MACRYNCCCCRQRYGARQFADQGFGKAGSEKFGAEVRIIITCCLCRTRTGIKVMALTTCLTLIYLRPRVCIHTQRNNSTVSSDTSPILGLLQGESKSSLPTTFDDIFAWAESFCIKFCRFIGNLYPRMFIDFRLFILTFDEMALILSRAPTLLRFQVWIVQQLLLGDRATRKHAKDC